MLRSTKLAELNLSCNLISKFPAGIENYENLNYPFLNNNTDKLSSESEEFKWALKKLQDKGVRINFDY